MRQRWSFTRIVHIVTPLEAVLPLLLCLRLRRVQSDEALLGISVGGALPRLEGPEQAVRLFIDARRVGRDVEALV